MYTYNTMRARIIIFLLLVTVYAQNLSAQNTSFVENFPVNGGAGGIPELQEKVSYTALPERPKVGDLVDFSVEMYGTPVKDAVFTWNIDGKFFKKGQGLNKISIYVQKNTKVSVSILTIKGTTLTKEWNFNIQDLVILWETDTYTPPFYKGKSLFTPESTLVLHGINLDSKNPLTNTYANYVWKTDGTVHGDESGVGKRSFIYKGNILMQEPFFELLYSNVSSYQGVNTVKTSSASTRAILQVQTLDTDIFTYEKTPLLGVLFNKKVDSTYLLQKPETTLVAYPVYYTTPSSLSLSYSWNINDTPVKTNSNFLTFKKTRDNETSRLTIDISNPKSLLQSITKTHIIDTTTKDPSTGSVVGGFGK